MERKPTGISEEMAAYLRRRTQWFQRATQRRGMPMVYGHGKPPKEQKKGKGDG